MQLRIVLKIFFICPFVFSLLTTNAQDVYKAIQPVEFVIKAKQYKDGSNGKQILSSLAINNIKNIYAVSIYLKGDLLISIRHDEGGHLFAYVKMIHLRLSGDTQFREFPIDTLLLPKAFEGKLLLSYHGNQLSEIPVEMLLSGGVLDLEAMNNFITDINGLSTELTISRFLFSDRQFYEFMERAGTVNAYYSYSEVLRLLLEKLKKKHINRGSSSAATFVTWHEINRVMSYLDTHHFQDALHLTGFDPEKLLEKKKELAPLELRANTLFIKELETSRKGKLTDRDKYCHDYVDISMKYIRLAEQYPPNMATAFNELVHIYPVKEDLNRVSNVSLFYDKFHISGIAETKQRIYNYFVAKAQSELEKEAYLNALALIRNARELQQFFSSIKRSERFDNVYTQALDGLMSSFLQVSVMAYKAHNFKMARRYYRNAQNIYDEHMALLGNQDDARYSFRNFVEKQVELADLLLNNRSYNEAVTILDDAKSILLQNRLDMDSLDLEAKYRKGYTGIYETLVDSVAYYIEQEKKGNGLSLLLHSADFERSHADYVDKDERLTSYAYLLYNDYYSKGKAKMEGSHPEKAIHDLLEAKKINELFLKQKDTAIDSLISTAAVPQIMHIIKKAEFESWANHLDRAVLMKKKAQKLQQTYNVSHNPQINEALAVLEEKIKKRVCVSVRYEVEHNCDIVRNRINSGKYKEAERRLSDIFNLLKMHQQCTIDRKVPDSLRNVYAPLFDELHKIDSLPFIIENNNYEEVRSFYNSLQRNYEKHKLNVYLKNVPALPDLIREQQNRRISEEAVQYYLEKKEWKEAFQYLNLLKDIGVSAKDTKNYQKVLGVNLCSGKVQKKQYISQLTKDDAWYKVLRTSCGKN